MFLKSLEIQGFKSFADKVQFTFSPGVTAIVGPNGSGKSNVVDSIRWVLGEQSAKSLRGSKMEDIIFSGSIDRKPVGMAKVTMVLDNRQRLFPMDSDEIEVSRVLHRSGESNYLLNKSSCRLKDIQELFMDTGLGKDGFSVIGQGKIEEILTLHAEERRGLIEEAAGISKYKYRKREAERKLEATEDDMTRLDDILFELEKRLEPLAEQAEKVRVYRVLKDEETTLQLAHLTKQYLSSKKSIDEKEKSVFSEKQKALEWQTSVNRLEADISQNKFNLDERRHQLEEMQVSYNDAFRQTQDCEKKLSVLSERYQNKNNLIATLIREHQQNVEKKRLLEDEMKNSQMHFEEYRLKIDEIDKSVLDIQNQLEHCKNKVVQEKMDIDSVQDKKISILSEKSRIDSDIVRIQESLNGESAHKIRVENNLYRLKEEKDKLEKNLLSNENERVALLNKDKEIRDNIEVINARLAHNKHLANDYNQQRQDIMQQLARSKSRLDTLEDFEANGEGYFHGVKAVLRAKKEQSLSGIFGSVLQLLEIPTEYLVAIENALGGSAQNVVVENDRDAQQAISWLKKERSGRVTFMPLNLVHGKKKEIDFNDSAVIGLALDLVHYDKKYETVMAQLLGRVWILKDLESATRLSKRTGSQYRFVTLDGDVISPGGTMTGGHGKKQNSILYRKQEMGSLRETIATLDQKNRELENKSAQLENKIKEDSGELQRIQQALQKYQLELREISVLKEQLEGQWIRVENDIKEEETNTNELKEFDLTAQNDLQKLQAKSVEIEDTLKTIELELQRRQNVLLEQEHILQNTQQNVQEALIEQVGVHNQYQSYEKNHVDGLKKLEELNSLIENQEIEKSQLLNEKNNIEKQIAEAKTILQQVMIDYQVHEKNVKDEKEEITQLQTELNEQEKKNNILRKESEALWKAYNVSSMKLERIQEKIKYIEQQILEAFSISPQEAIAQADLELDTSKAPEKLKELRKKIENLGEINFTALEEHERVSHQVVFLKEQVEDLASAKNKLITVIREMESTMAQRFKDAYEKVNKHFADIFKMMFNGGEARLELSMPGRYLETGVEIVAQPPGKKERVLTLLSGGERALTATALLFALLEVRPSPFVILDEIEAALDEANVERFAKFIQQYASNTQFIIISHRKGTMEAASVLYGITMDSKGVSKQLSVRLEDLNLEREA